MNGTPVLGSMVTTSEERVESALAAMDTLSKLALLTRPLLLERTFILMGEFGKSRRWLSAEEVADIVICEFE